MAAKFNYTQIEGIQGNSFVTSDFISGDGTLALTNASSSQIAFAAVQNINLCGGVLRATSAALGGAGAAGGPNATFNFYGGVLELDGGFILIRALDLAATALGGAVNFDVSGTQRGSGGFSAINGARFFRIR